MLRSGRSHDWLNSKRPCSPPPASPRRLQGAAGRQRLCLERRLAAAHGQRRLRRRRPRLGDLGAPLEHLLFAARGGRRDARVAGARDRLDARDGGRRVDGGCCAFARAAGRRSPPPTTEKPVPLAPSLGRLFFSTRPADASGRASKGTGPGDGGACGARSSARAARPRARTRRAEREHGFLIVGAPRPTSRARSACVASARSAPHSGTAAASPPRPPRCRARSAARRRRPTRASRAGAPPRAARAGSRRRPVAVDSRSS